MAVDSYRQTTNHITYCLVTRTFYTAMATPESQQKRDVCSTGSPLKDEERKKSGGWQYPTTVTALTTVMNCQTEKKPVTIILRRSLLGWRDWTWNNSRKESQSSKTANNGSTSARQSQLTQNDIVVDTKTKINTHFSTGQWKTRDN